MHKFTYFSQKRDYEVSLDDGSSDTGHDISEKSITQAQINLGKKVDELIELSSKNSMREDTILIVDYDNTIILRDQNTHLQNVLFPTECNSFISSYVLNERASDHQLSEKFSKNLQKIANLIEQNFDDSDLQVIMNTQYALLNFFNILLDFLVKSRINRIYLVSSSSISLILKGIFIISNAIQYISNVPFPATYNPVSTLYEKGFLHILSTANNPFPQKQKTFANLAQMGINESAAVKHLISIGDGPDQEMSAKMVGQASDVEVHVYRFLFQDYEDIEFNSLLSFHRYLNEHLINQNPIFVDMLSLEEIPIIEEWSEQNQEGRETEGKNNFSDYPILFSSNSSEGGCMINNSNHNFLNHPNEINCDEGKCEFFVHGSEEVFVDNPIEPRFEDVEMDIEMEIYGDDDREEGEGKSAQFFPHQTDFEINQNQAIVQDIVNNRNFLTHNEYFHPTKNDLLKVLKESCGSEFNQNTIGQHVMILHQNFDDQPLNKEIPIR